MQMAAETIGHPPTREEYEGEYERRRESEAGRWPSAAEIDARFGGWPFALEAAGLGPAMPATALERSASSRHDPPRARLS